MILGRALIRDADHVTVGDDGMDVCFQAACFTGRVHIEAGKGCVYQAPKEDNGITHSGLQGRDRDIADTSLPLM